VSASLLLLLPAPYVAAGVGYAEARRRGERPPTWARVLGVATPALHLVGLLLLSGETHRSPFQTESQALSFLAFALAALYAVLERTSKVARYGGGFFLLAGAVAAAAVPGLAREDLSPTTAASDPTLAYHVGFALLGTAAIFAAGLFAAGYLGAYRRAKRGQVSIAAEDGPSLFGLQRLARDASWAGLVLLAPALALGVSVASREGASPSARAEIAVAAVEFLLLAVAAWLWWRRPLRGAVAAWLGVASALLAVAAFLVVHPLLARGVGP
jgi:ABC-type uncharacterized transport system permease subunit